jgi:hypothetical protein
MKNVHYGHCLIGVALGVILLIAFGVSAGTLGFLAVVLLCPLMMTVMMRMLMGGNKATPAQHDVPVDRTPRR